ncbi:MAG: hypothetical protein Q9219_000653 [cf. Caloplaca sp. 3 TL-2023]
MSSTKSIPPEISGYRILPVSLPPLPSYPVSATHFLYVHPHEPKLPTPTAVRSLFLVNIPFDSTELHIKNLFSSQIGLPQGRIEEIQFADSKKNTAPGENAVPGPLKEKRGKKRKRDPGIGAIEDLEGAALPATWDRELRTQGLTAVVVFVDRASMDVAYKTVKKIRKADAIPVWGEGLEGKVPALGSASGCADLLLPMFDPNLFAGYLNHHRLQYPDKDQLMQSVNTYMTAYAAREAAQARLLAQQRQVPDEDGFITVTKGGRNGPARQDIAQEVATKHKEKQKGLEDFYRFQHREKKKLQAAELSRRFEEDREKLKRMKEKQGTFKVSFDTNTFSYQT